MIFRYWHIYMIGRWHATWKSTPYTDLHCPSSRLFHWRFILLWSKVDRDSRSTHRAAISPLVVDANDPTAARSFPFQLSNAVDKISAKCVHKDCVPWEDSPHSGASKSIHDGSIICLQNRKKIKIMSSTMRSFTAGWKASSPKGWLVEEWRTFRSKRSASNFNFISRANYHWLPFCPPYSPHM